MATILGSASKTFGELVKGDKVYYIDPKQPTEINYLPVKEVEPCHFKKGYVFVEYYQSSEVLGMTTLENEHIVPTRKLLVKAGDTQMLAMSMPPTVYFTNEKALRNFMGSEYKSTKS